MLIYYPKPIYGAAEFYRCLNVAYIVRNYVHRKVARQNKLYASIDSVWHVLFCFYFALMANQRYDFITNSNFTSGVYRYTSSTETALV